jgi:hypothetical protein
MIFKACALALVAVFCTVILRELGWRGAGITATLVAVILFSALAEGIASGAREIEGLTSLAELSDYGKCVLKIIGLGYVYGMSADICRDMDRGSVASALCAVGRVEILLTVLPYFRKILDLGLKLLG